MVSILKENRYVRKTYTAVASTEKTYRGRCAQSGKNTWKARPKEYIVGAMFAVTLKLSRTVRNFPKPPVGRSTAMNRSPRDSDPYASFQLGTRGMETAKAAPRH